MQCYAGMGGLKKGSGAANVDNIVRLRGMKIQPAKLFIFHLIVL